MLAGGIGSSLAITLWEKREAFHHTRLTEGFTPFSAQTQMLQQVQQMGMTPEQTQGVAAMQITQQGFILSASELYYASSILFLLLVVLIWFARPPFHTNAGEH